VSSDAVLALGALAACAAVALDPTRAASGPILCPFRLATGIECPACGSVRAWVAATSGDVGAALDHNAFAVVLLVATVVLVAWRVVSSIAPMPRPDVGRLLASPAMLVAVSAWVAWWAVGLPGA
jgi:hypothetical protein